MNWPRWYPNWSNGFSWTKPIERPPALCRGEYLAKKASVKVAWYLLWGGRWSHKRLRGAMESSH